MKAASLLRIPWARTREPVSRPLPPPQTRVFVNAVTQRVEGLDLIYCPPERQVLVDVPVRLLNDDLAPGVKKGGWIALFK